MAEEYGEIKERIDQEMADAQYEEKAEKITHVENLFIISYLTKALQDLLIQKAKFFQYPLLLIDLPLALAILIVNVERILYVRILGYIMAHIEYDVNIFRSLVKSEMDNKVNVEESWQERAFDFIRKVLRFIWGLIILMFILPVWPIIWIYNQMVQTLLIGVIYYFLMFSDFSFVGGFLVYYILLVTVTFLVACITVPFIFRISVYVKEMFSLERKSWKRVNSEAKMAFVHFYQRLHGNYAQALQELKFRYADEYKAEGGVYYMLLKFIHFLKDKFWKLKEKKMEAVVGKIQDKTVEFVDEYYQEKNAYYVALRSFTPRDLRRTIVALSITVAFSLLLVFQGSNGKGIVGPILLSFADQPVSEEIWVSHHEGRGYYEDMVDAYALLPNALEYVAIGVDSVFNYFFQSYYFLYPLYLDFLVRYYMAYFNFFVSGVLGGLW